MARFFKRGDIMFTYRVTEEGSTTIFDDGIVYGNFGSIEEAVQELDKELAWNRGKVQRLKDEMEEIEELSTNMRQCRDSLDKARYIPDEEEV